MEEKSRGLKKDHIRFSVFPGTEGSGSKAYFECCIHEDDELRPAMLVVPGGGYDHLSDVESYHVAGYFFDRGFQTFILAYSTAPIGKGPLGLKPLKEITRAVRLIRSMADEFKIKDGKLAACGFSAGGHLIATLCAHPDTKGNYSDPESYDDPYDDISALPDAVILGYPVITMSGTCVHESSVRQLLGNAPSREELDFMSAQLHVSKMSPPAFIWSIADDKSVPVENSYMYAESCREKGCPFALHIFSHGEHGMAMADGYDGRFTSDETALWPELAISFVKEYLR